MTLRLTHRRYRLAFRQPVRTAHGWWSEREGLLVRVADAAGRHAFGDVTPIPWFGTESVDEAEKACAALAESFSPESAAVLPSGLVCLRSALGFAIEALTGSPAGAAGRPGVSALPVAALLPAGRTAPALAATRAEAGFRVFKWKVGVADPSEELGVLDDLLAELPEGSKLRLDANGAWDRRQAERWLARCAERPVEYVEQPCAAGPAVSGPERTRAADLLLGLAHDFPTPLALDEAVVSAGEVGAWLDLGWPGIFVVKPALLGDVPAVLARLAGRKAPVVFSSALETAVGAKAVLRCAFGHDGGGRALGAGVWPLFQDGRFDGPAAAPFVRASDVEAIDEEAVWNALS